MNSDIQRLFFFSFLYEGREEERIQIALNQPASECHFNGISLVMAFRWWADDGPTLNTVLAALRFFRGSGLILQRNPTFA